MQGTAISTHAGLQGGRQPALTAWPGAPHAGPQNNPVSSHFRSISCDHSQKSDHSRAAQCLALHAPHHSWSHNRSTHTRRLTLSSRSYASNHGTRTRAPTLNLRHAPDLLHPTRAQSQRYGATTHVRPFSATCIIMLNPASSCALDVCGPALCPQTASLVPDLGLRPTIDPTNLDDDEWVCAGSSWRSGAGRDQVRAGAQWAGGS